MTRIWLAAILSAPMLCAQGNQKWVTSWAASAHGPYAYGNASAQPNLRFAFPDPATGAHDQSFRLMLLPDIWGRQARVRFTNAFGTRPVTFDGIYAGLALTGGAVMPGTNLPVHFAGKSSVMIAPG